MAELFYLMGASGSGKDSLLRYARHHPLADAEVMFAHRYITRPVEAGGENHIALTEREFAKYRNKGCFVMHWQCHGLHYGIGFEVEHWLSKGLSVVMNGSRGYLDEAARRYRELRPILVRVSPDVLAERLRQRGRESDTQIAERLQRTQCLRLPAHPRMTIIDNDKSLKDAGDQLVRLITNAGRVVA